MMGSPVDYAHKHYNPLLQKTLRNALAHRIGKEFPRLGGARILGLCADIILEEIGKHLQAREHVRHGQALWLAISVDDPPRRNRMTADTDLVPVVLDLSTAHDIEERLARKSSQQRLLHKALRLCLQAYEQGGLLSNCDLAELLCTNDTTIAGLLADHERDTGKMVPRRATLHDVGSGLTHKRIICLKRYRDGKTSDVIARETYHKIESVDRYLGQFDRVRCCRREAMTPEQTAYILNCSSRLVDEYLAIDNELTGGNRPSATAPESKDKQAERGERRRCGGKLEDDGSLHIPSSSQDRDPNPQTSKEKTPNP